MTKMLCAECGKKRITKTEIYISITGLNKKTNRINNYKYGFCKECLTKLLNLKIVELVVRESKEKELKP